MKQQENIYRTGKFLTQDRSYLKTLWGLCLCQNNNIWVFEEVVSHCTFFTIFDRLTIFFRISFVSHGIALAKHMVKQVEVIFFPSDKKFEWPYYIEN